MLRESGLIYRNAVSFLASKSSLISRDLVIGDAISPALSFTVNSDIYYHQSQEACQVPNHCQRATLSLAGKTLLASSCPRLGPVTSLAADTVLFLTVFMLLSLMLSGHRDFRLVPQLVNTVRTDFHRSLRRSTRGPKWELRRLTDQKGSLPASLDQEQMERGQ
jgi:hypothetical protein